MQRRATGTRLAAFTLPELILILVLVGILAAFAVPYFASQRDDGPIRARAEFLSAWRYAQQLAMADATRGIQLQVSAGSYRIYDSTGNLPLADASGNYPQNFPDGVSVEPALSVCFTSLGEVLQNCSGNAIAVTFQFKRDGVTRASACIERSGYARFC